MNDHPCTRAFDHQGGTTVPGIIGASIASVTTVSLATFFWSHQAGFWLLALLAASYLPTPVTDPRLKLHRASSCLWFGSPGLCSLLRPGLLVAFPFHLAGDCLGCPPSIPPAPETSLPPTPAGGDDVSALPFSGWDALVFFHHASGLCRPGRFCSAPDHLPAPCFPLSAGSLCRPLELGLGHCPGAGRPCRLQPQGHSFLPLAGPWQAPTWF